MINKAEYRYFLTDYSYHRPRSNSLLTKPDRSVPTNTVASVLFLLVTYK